MVDYIGMTVKSQQKNIEDPEKDNELRYIRGIGPVRASSLKRIGIRSALELLMFFPKWHVYKSLLTPIKLADQGAKCFIKGRITLVDELKRPGRSIIKVTIDDESGAALTWIWYNRPYLRGVFKTGQLVLLHDTVEATRWGLQITGTTGAYEFITEEENALLEKGKILGFYKATKILSHEFFREAARTLIDSRLKEVEEMLSAETTVKYDLFRMKEAVMKFHFPETAEELEKARRRLVFNELFLLQLFLAKRKMYLGRKVKNREYSVSPKAGAGLISKLPFELTGAQKRVIEEISEDLNRRTPMNRLLQGDVGSGKTIVALVSQLKVLENGYQAAIMAPTEILAEQHYVNYKKMLELINSDKKIILLTSKLTAKQRREALSVIKSGEAALVIGTHALIQEDVEFKDLGFIVIDERHKFGVFQRMSLEAKGIFPDCLMMTATPFPRALVLTLYGDTDLSVLDELPKGRQPIYTKWVYEKRREDVYTFMRSRLEAGEQAYVVYPLVEESDKLTLKAAETEAAYLKSKVFPTYRVGLIHGRMKGEEKDSIMAGFKAGQIHILVSTTVIEVGIDVSNATVMLIEHTERFGLAQLHQLRGRVGRGAKKSFCFLMTSWNISSDAFKRLKIMENTNDGFKIAEADLLIRGPGELFGQRQHGELDLKLIDLSRDNEVLELARQEAFKLVSVDPLLANPENAKIKRYFEKKFSADMELITIS